jgi:two-component system capsular synthesis response regulator RcsB
VSATLSIAIADDHPLMLRGIADLIDSLEQYDLAGQAVDATSAMAIVENSEPDVLLMDFSMPGDVLGTISRIVADYPRTRIIILTAFSSRTGR